MFLSPAFWSEVLEPLVTTRAGVPAGPPPRSSRLRRALNADWDHGFMDVVVQQVAPPRFEAPARDVERAA